MPKQMSELIQGVAVMLILGWLLGNLLAYSFGFAYLTLTKGIAFGFFLIICFVLINLFFFKKD